MLNDLNLSDLIDYTAWERQKWYDWFQWHGEQVRKASAGPHGDGRFETVGELVRHIFSAEKRYVERISGLSLTDAASIPSNDLEALFRFGKQSRQALKELVENFPHAELGYVERHHISEFESFCESHAKEDRYACADSQNSPLGADCHTVPSERFGGRLS